MLKILLLVSAVSSGKFKPFVGDNATEHYLPIADRLLSEGRFNGPDSRANSKVPIGYPLFLAATKFVAGQRFLMLACCLQVLADLAVAALLYALGIRLSSPAAGFLAGLFWLLYPPAVLVATWITAENLFTLALLSSLMLLIVSLQSEKVWTTLAAGIVLGIATMLRGTCLLLPVFLFPVFYVPACFRCIVPHGPAKGVCFIAGLACVVLPWRMRNQIVLNDPIAVSTGFGSAFLQGSDEKFFTIEGKREYYAEAYAQAAADGVIAPPPDARESLQDNHMLRVGIDQYRRRLSERPASFIPFAALKAVRLWYGTETGNRKSQLLLAVTSIIIVPLGLWRIIRLRKLHPAETAILGGTLLYFFMMHWISLPEYRYMHPIMPLLILGAADGIASFFTGPFCDQTIGPR